MYTPQTKVTILWKEYLLICFIVFLVFIVWDLIILASYKKVANDFLSRRYDTIETRAKKLQKRLYPSLLPGRKNLQPYYNSICHILASMALLSGDEIEFFSQIDKIKGGGTFPLKPFTLSLYFRSKGQLEFAKTYYEELCSCAGVEKHMRTVMDFFFAAEDNTIDDEILQHAAKQFKNPAIILLLERNGLTVC